MSYSPSARQSGFIHIIVAVIIVAIIAASVGGFIYLKHKGSDKGGASLQSWLDGCSGDNKVAMSHMPMDAADVSSIYPMGLVAGAHVTPIDHLYFFPKSNDRYGSPVYAMADGTIKELAIRTTSVDTGNTQQADYHIVMQHSCRTMSYYDLVTKLAPAIDAAWKDKDNSGVNIPIKAGQVIGYVGGQSLDTAIYDMQLSLPGLIDPDMYKEEPWKVHTDDFFSYYSGNDKATMLALDQRKVEPYGGKIDYDQAGKLIGNWFVEGTNGYAGPANIETKDGHGYWNTHLSIHYDPINPNLVVVSIGDYKDNKPDAFYVKGNAPDPATVDATSGVVKYELLKKPTGIQAPDFVYVQDQTVQGTVLLQVQSGEKLKVEVGVGKTADQMTSFSSAAKTYER